MEKQQRTPALQDAPATNPAALAAPRSGPSSILVFVAVARECGTESVIGVGSSDLIDHKMSILISM